MGKIVLGLEASKIYAIALSAWEAMARYETLPTPSNFEVWFSYYGLTNPELVRRLNTLLEAEQRPDAKFIENLHRTFLSPKIDMSAIREHSMEMKIAADSVIDHVADGQRIFRDYGQSLAHWTQGFDAAERVGDNGSATLAVSTSTALERSRLLEEKLSLSVAQIALLQTKLAEVERAATTDSLTGIFNRLMFDSVFNGATTEAAAGRSDLSLLLIDIDHFKKFNDSFGHRTGDQVLRIVAQQLIAAIPEEATAARYGGEEFAVILPGLKVSASLELADAVRKSMAERRIVNRSSGQDYGAITVSIGVSSHRPGDDPESLIERADQFLYEAKRLGRNQVCGELPIRAPAEYAGLAR